MNNGVKSIKLCFGANCSFLSGLDSDTYEHQYNTIYKPLISTLYTISELPFTLYLSGVLINWMEHHHPEFFMILEEMVARKQIDILGGGYYSPLFPLVPSADRVGQIELLTTVLRGYFGKRPRGAWLPSSAWEPSIVTSLNTCGIEYILLDKTMLETSEFTGVDGYAPVTVEDSGKTITVLPLDNRFRTLENLSPESFIQEISIGLDVGKERLIVIFFEQAALTHLLFPDDSSASWIQNFFKCLPKAEATIELTTTARYLKNKTLYERAYISSGMSPSDFGNLSQPRKIQIQARTSAKHFLLKSCCIMNLYAKMMYVHILVNQLRGDKSRKKNAREELWQAQNSDVYRIVPTNDTNRQRLLRTLAYKNLLIAEKLTRLRGVFSPSVIAFDFDMDGLKEYLCQLDSLNMYVHSFGGKIFEFDVFSVYRNYCDVSLPFSGLFIDHFLANEDVSHIVNGGIRSTTQVFSNTIYQDVAVDPSRHEINLKATGFFGVFQQPLSLRKQYSFRNEGIQVQYILKNDSPLNLSGVFAIEINLSVAETKQQSQIMSVCSHDLRKEGSIESGTFEDVSWMQIDDPETGIKFTLDSNENATISVFPIVCDATVANTSSFVEGVRLILYWKVDLGPNYEMEKMAFLKIDT